ncbi:hypothetical protein CspeluHIS016_0305340 [Cutaneotrichosporon spelunceum]|uniref:Protein kinase domain-containing protein n=1 Tax=Cutaneotrichosporon spelunceum TaxID=1672016 RepID=A0AAD3YCC2_9TREE|nr:hypothetical protein CspeluHIS016_0305340 [Cutaneotrichosporon spelunceum]
MMTVWDTPRGRLSRVGEYDLGETIGRGAYAHVREAVHRETGQLLACKILPALHVPGAPATWDKTIDAIEAHKEMVLLKAFAGAGIPGIVKLEGMLEEDGWTCAMMTTER